MPKKLVRYFSFQPGIYIRTKNHEYKNPYRIGERNYIVEQEVKYAG